MEETTAATREHLDGTRPGCGGNETRHRDGRLVRMPRRRDYRPLGIDSSHWRRDGRPKVRYPTRADALVAADDRSRDAGAPLDVYECPFCGGWHMGKRAARSGRLGDE